MKIEGSRRSYSGRDLGKDAGGMWEKTGMGSAQRNPPSGAEAGVCVFRHRPRELGRWPAQPAQAQLLKIRVKNLSSWLVPQEPVALATPSSWLPRLAAGPCASPPCWPLCQPSACPSGEGRAPRGPGGSSRAQWPECETCVGLCRWLSVGGCVTVCATGLCRTACVRLSLCMSPPVT